MQGAQSGGQCTRGHLGSSRGLHSPMGSDVGASGCGTMQLCTGGGEASVPVRSLHEGPRGLQAASGVQRAAGAGGSARRAHGCSDGRARGRSRKLRERQESYDYRVLRAPSCGGGQDKSRDHERRGERTNRVWVKHRVPPREHGATRPAGATEDRSVDRRAHPATGPAGHVPGRGPTRPQVSTHIHGPTGPRQETSRSRPISRHRVLLRRVSSPRPRRCWVFRAPTVSEVPPFAAD